MPQQPKKLHFCAIVSGHQSCVKWVRSESCSDAAEDQVVSSYLLVMFLDRKTDLPSVLLHQELSNFGGSWDQVCNFFELPGNSAAKLIFLSHQVTSKRVCCWYYIAFVVLGWLMPSLPASLYGLDSCGSKPRNGTRLWVYPWSLWVQCECATFPTLSYRATII